MSDEETESIRLKLEEALNSLSDSTEQNFEAAWQTARRLGKVDRKGARREPFGVRKP